VRSTDRVFDDRTTGPGNTIWESSRATLLSQSDSTASVLSCFTKSRRRGSHRFLRSRLRTEGRSRRLGGPRRRKRLGCRLRHAEAWNQPARFLGSSQLRRGITLWHRGRDPESRTFRVSPGTSLGLTRRRLRHDEGAKKGREVRLSLGNSPSERGFHDLSLGRVHVRRAF
jgi:hypothetical protein